MYVVTAEMGLGCANRPAIWNRGMDESNLTIGAWWRVGVLASSAWVTIAALTGSSILALIILPVIAELWVYAIVAVDRWQNSSNRVDLGPRRCPRGEVGLVRRSVAGVRNHLNIPSMIRPAVSVAFAISVAFGPTPVRAAPLIDGVILSWPWSLPFIGILLSIATDQPDLVRGKIGRQRALLRRNRGGQRRVDEASQNPSGEKSFS
jgi:hypothetical protein